MVIVASSSGDLVSASITEPVSLPVWQKASVHRVRKKQVNKVCFKVSF